MKTPTTLPPPKHAPGTSHRELHARAHQAGLRAASTTAVKSWRVEGYDELFELIGKAHVSVRPGTGGFARWAKAERVGSRAVDGSGLRINPPSYRGSHGRKLAYCSGYADVLGDAGVDARAVDQGLD